VPYAVVNVRLLFQELTTIWSFHSAERLHRRVTPATNDSSTSMSPYTHLVPRRSRRETTDYQLRRREFSTGGSMSARSPLLRKRQASSGRRSPGTGSATPPDAGVDAGVKRGGLPGCGRRGPVPKFQASHTRAPQRRERNLGSSWRLPSRSGWPHAGTVRFIFRRGTASLRSTAARACCLRSQAQESAT